MDINTMLKEMSLEEKVGQLFMLAFAKRNLTEASILIKEHFVCGAYISNDNVPDPTQALKLSQELQALARQTRWQLPLLLSPDQEGTWAVMVPDSCPGPGNLALGASHHPENAYQMYRVIGEELAAVGLNAPFCPCADCNTDPKNAIIGMRSFGEDPQSVAEMTAAAVRGLKDAGLLATLKHFPGHGDTRLDSHRGLPTVSRERQALFDIDLLPFATGIQAGADIVMTSHIIYPAFDKDNPATLSHTILQEVLRENLGFKGVIISDSMNMKAMKRNYDPAEAAIEALRAGVDIIMLAEEHYDHNEQTYLANQLALINAVKTAVRQERLPIARVDDAVTRILTLKAGLKTHPLDASLVGSAAHREVERRVALAGTAILKNEAKLLPLSQEQSITLINTTQQASYEVLGNIRGVGPNQLSPAFDFFAQALQAQTQVTIIEAETYFRDQNPSLDGDVIVAVTENHTLPGMDFHQQSQQRIIRELAAKHGERLIVIGLRDPYELAHFPDIHTYLCSFSFRPCAAEAAVAVLLGQSEARGRSPVSIPGTTISARS